MVCVVALAGLYALPSVSATVCPEGEQWTCTERVESDAEATGDLANVDRGLDERDDADAVELEGELEVTGELYDISRGELIIGEDEWPHDLLTSTKWSYDLIEPTDNGSMFVVTYDADPGSTSAPRVMRPQPARLQILDPDREEIVFDAELPEVIENVEWISDDKLAVVTNDGAISVIERI